MSKSSSPVPAHASAGTGQSPRASPSAAADMGTASPAWSTWPCECEGLGFEVWGLGVGVWGMGFGVWGLGFGVRGLGFMVWDSVFGI